MVNHFASIADTLRLSLDDVRAEVASVFQTSGRMGMVIEGDGTEFRRRMIDVVHGDAPKLGSAFETLTSIELT